LRGSFDSSDVIYYLLFIATFLTLSIRRLDGQRLPH
jgi:ABC-2 type transport system permease protein